MIEKAPKVTIEKDTLDILISPDYRDAFDSIEKDYLYWDKAKYHFPKDIAPEKFWAAVKFSRIGDPIVFHRTIFYCKVTTYMQKFLHDFDMNFGGTIMSENTISSKNKQCWSARNRIS